MAKKGMKRPQETHTKQRNPVAVPEIQGEAKSGNSSANPIVENNSQNSVNPPAKKNKKK